MKRIVLSLVMAVGMVIPSVSVVNAAVKAGAVCSKLGQISTVSGKSYTCIKRGKNLYWNIGKKIVMPLPTSTKSAKPTPTPASTKEINSHGIQFIYGTADGCGNEIGYLRMDSSGNLISNRTIIQADNQNEVEPLDYWQDELLFVTSDCHSSGKVGATETLWRLNLSSPNSTPKEIYKITYQGTRNGLLIDAKIDIASNKSIVFAWMGGDQQVFTAETSPLIIWSLSRQGWLSAGIHGTAIALDTGWTLSVYGYNPSNSTWRSVYVDWRTEIAGIGKLTLRGYGNNAQFQGRGLVDNVTTGLFSMPYVFTTDQGLFMCVDFPTTSGPLVDVENNDRCTRVSGAQSREVAISSVDGYRPFAQGLVSIADKKIYIFDSGSIIGRWENPIKIVKTLDIAPAIRILPNIYYTVSIFGGTWDIDEKAPKLKFNGFFSNF